MPITLTPILTGQPNSGIASNQSWIEVENPNRPLFAQATYLTNASDINISLSAGNVSMDTSDLENLQATGNVLLGQISTKVGLGSSANVPMYIQNVSYDGLAPAPGTYNSLELNPPEKPVTFIYRNNSTLVATLSALYERNNLKQIVRL